MTNPRLTAVIPIARMAGRLGNLEHLLRTSVFIGIEIIIVHDEQDSYTGQEIGGIVQSVDSPLVSVITKSVYSPGKARNLGIEKATGDWICFWDSDDNPIPEVFLTMVREAELDGKEIAMGKFQRTERNKIEIFGTSEKEVGRMPGIWRFAFKKISIESFSFPSYRMGEDQVFLTNFTLPYSDYFKFEEVIYEYVVGNAHQLTKNSNAILELEFAIEEMLDRISESGIKWNLHQIFLSRQLLTIMGHGNRRLRVKAFRSAIKASMICGNHFLCILATELVLSLKKHLISRRTY